MSIPIEADMRGKIVYENNSFDLRNSPLNQETIDKCYEVIIKCGCVFSTRAFSFTNLFHYTVKNEKLCITSVNCMRHIYSKTESYTDMFFKMFNQHENFFVSWFSGELKVVKNMVASGDRTWIYDYDLLILKIENGRVIESYEKQETVKGLKKLPNYIEE